MSISKALNLTWFFNDSYNQIPPAHRAEFMREVHYTNFSRSTALAGLAVLTSLSLIYLMDIKGYRAIPASVAPYALLIHLGICAMGAGFLLMTRFKSVRAPDAIEPVHIAASVGFNIGMLLLMDGLFILTIIHDKTNMVYVINVFAISAMFFYPGKINLILYTANFIFYLVVVALCVQNPDLQFSAYLSGTIVTLMAWVLAKLALESRVRDFLNTKTIEAQATSLQQANTQLEQQATALQLANTELEQRNLQLDFMNQEKNEFLGIAAHDLKSPLTNIIGYGEMIKEEPSMERDEINKYLDVILESSKRMVELIRNLLDVNAIERGELKCTLAPCELARLAHNVVDSYQHAAAVKQQNILFQADTQQAQVLADHNIIVQALDNLVSNAVKYSPPGKNIYVRIKTQPTSVRCEVQDEGPGFSAEDKKKLFGKFARLSAKPTAGEHSTGLGLSIVKKLVEAMHGQVWCESEIGQGATFIIELPAPPNTELHTQDVVLTQTPAPLELDNPVARQT